MTSVDLNMGHFFNQNGIPYSTQFPHDIRVDVLKSWEDAEDEKDNPDD